MYKKGKVYKTVSGYPAKILWIFTENSSDSGSMVVLHSPYSEHECIRRHKPDGTFSSELPHHDLSLEEYIQNFYDKRIHL